MSLFALRYAYQRSFDRLWEDYSADFPAQAQPAPKEVERKSHQSVLNLHSHREGFMQKKIQNATTPQGSGGSELMQYDAKAWGCFLDSKRKE